MPETKASSPPSKSGTNVDPDIDQHRMAKLSGVFLCAALFLNEDFGPIKIIAAILVMAGLLINVFGRKLMKQFSRKKSQYHQYKIILYDL